LFLSGVLEFLSWAIVVIVTKLRKSKRIYFIRKF
jgi:hypothetical protein